MKAKSTRYYSNIQEERISKNINGKRQPNSGATTFAKGDVSNESFIFEAKTSTTAKSSYTVHKTDLEKLKQQAIGQLKRPVFVFDFGDGEDYYIIDKNLARDLLSD